MFYTLGNLDKNLIESVLGNFQELRKLAGKNKKKNKYLRIDKIKKTSLNIKLESGLYCWKNRWFCEKKYVIKNL